MRNAYTEQLELLHSEMVHMGKLCETAVNNAICALTDNDLTLLGTVFETDGEIDRLEREVESLCMKLLLRQQPVASDLRAISSALKMISDMERIGDQASDIGEIVRFIVGRTNHNEQNLQQMALAAVKMVNDSVDSYVKKDLQLAAAVIEYDDVVDDWFVRIKRELIGLIQTDGSQGEYYVDLLMIAKYLERIADHATNIAEWVEYSITGTHVSHEHGGAV